MSNGQQALPKQTNGLGLAGFIIALVGLCSGGVLSPIGLILALVALKDRPKGLAIAGVVIGALGSCGILVSLIFLPFLLASLLVALGATGLALAIGGNQLMAQAEMTALHDRIGEYQQSHGTPPLLLTDLDPAPDQRLLTDPWGNPYEYVAAPDGTFTLRSLGEDGVTGTGDDIVFDPDFEVRLPASAFE